MNEAKKFAYAAYVAADKSRSGAIDLLDSLLAASFQDAAATSGKIMTTVSATNKSFAFTLPQGYGPKEIGDMAFEALRILTNLTDDTVESVLLARPVRAQAVRYC